MPKQTIYVRDEDMEKWKALKDKSTKIHEMLVGIPPTYTPQSATTLSPGFKGIVDGVHVVVPQTPTSISQPFVPKPPDPETGYPCCQSTTHQCKHWVFDGVRSAWVNTLTGKEREVV